MWKCYTIQVNLKNEYGLLKSLKHYEGIYEISSTINGKPSWISTSNHKAIWFINKKNYWLMGKLNRIGNDFAEIFAKSNKYSGPFNTNNVWQYFNNGWKVAKKGDINVQCITKAGTCLLPRVILESRLVATPLRIMLKDNFYEFFKRPKSIF